MTQWHIETKKCVAKTKLNLSSLKNLCGSKKKKLMSKTVKILQNVF